jgi:hypothetical protein
MPKHTIKWGANYSRIGTAVIEKAVCKGCSRNTDCLVMDSSEGEYGVGALCKNCINMLFEFPETKILKVEGL